MVIRSKSNKGTATHTKFKKKLPHNKVDKHQDWLHNLHPCIQSKLTWTWPCSLLWAEGWMRPSPQVLPPGLILQFRLFPANIWTLQTSTLHCKGFFKSNFAVSLVNLGDFCGFGALFKWDSTAGAQPERHRTFSGYLWGSGLPVVQGDGKWNIFFSPQKQVNRTGFCNIWEPRFFLHTPKLNFLPTCGPKSKR